MENLKFYKYRNIEKCIKNLILTISLLYSLISCTKESFRNLPKPTIHFLLNIVCNE